MLAVCPVKVLMTVSSAAKNPLRTKLGNVVLDQSIGGNNVSAYLLNAGLDLHRE